MIVQMPEIATDSESAPPPYAVSAIDGALRLLLLLQDRGTLGVSQAARELDMARSTVHRMLTTMQHRGFVQQEPDTKSYSLGAALIDIGLTSANQMDVRVALHPLAVELRDRTGETVHVVVLRGADVMFVDGAESDHVVRTALRVGDRVPAYASSGGKALLAALPESKLEEYLDDYRFSRLTPKTIADKADLEEELARVRHDGYATNVAESERDLASVGLAVRDKAGVARAALAISMPLARFDDSKRNEIVAALQDLATRVDGRY